MTHCAIGIFFSEGFKNKGAVSIKLEVQVCKISSAVSRHFRIPNSLQSLDWNG